MANEQELELIEDRTISGTGVLKVPESVGIIRYARLNIDVIRKVEEPHLSGKFSPPRSRFCTLVFLKNGYVIEEQAVDYEARQFDFRPEITAQNLAALRCMYADLRIFFSFDSLLSAAVVATVPNKIENYRPINTFWDEVRVVCEGSTAVQVRLYIQELEKCGEQEEDEPDEPPPPEEPIPPVPPTTPIDTSPPYPDDEITDPNDIDNPEPPLPEDQEPCQIYKLTYDYLIDGVLFDTRTLNTSAPFRAFPPTDDPLIGAPTNPDGATSATIQIQGSNCDGGGNITDLYGTIAASISWGGNITRQFIITNFEVL